MAKKKGTNFVKLGYKALEFLRPVVYYGFIPTVIIIGMRTEPRPRYADLRAARRPCLSASTGAGLMAARRK